MGLLTLLTLGFFLGMRHATDSDHVIAVTTIVSREKSVRAASLVGALWGVGHTLTIMFVGGAIILEYIFSYYGLGSYLLIAITSQDRFLAGSILFLISVLVIFGNIVADILYGVLDPRVRI